MMVIADQLMRIRPDLEHVANRGADGMSRWLIVGSGGMLGRDLLATVATNGADVVGLTTST